MTYHLDTASDDPRRGLLTAKAYSNLVRAVLIRSLEKHHGGLLRVFTRGYVYKSSLDSSDMQVPPLKQRIAGKSIPVEKFVIAKSERYLQGARLPLCGLEMVYAWNGFQMLIKNRALLDGVLRVVWDERMTVEETREGNESYADDWAVISLIQGVCFKGMKRFDEAQDCFEAVVNRARELQYDHYAAPAASLELGLLHLELGNLEEAERILETTRTAYKGYHLESRIHFRIHAGLCRISQLKASS